MGSIALATAVAHSPAPLWDADVDKLKLALAKAEGDIDVLLTNEWPQARIVVQAVCAGCVQQATPLARCLGLCCRLLGSGCGRRERPSARNVRRNVIQHLPATAGAV